jgi:hypothetical protein
MHGSILALAAALVLAVAACGSDRVSPHATTSGSVPVASPGPGATDTSEAPAPTVVPGGVSVSPGPPFTRIPTTQTDWGAILDALPDGFPVYPTAEVAEPPPEPVSAAFSTPDPVDRVAGWYRDALEAAGFSTVDLSEPLEDGSRVLDSQTDVPECRVQVTFRPEGGSTMITVLYGAGCAGAGG